MTFSLVGRDARTGAFGDGRRVVEPGGGGAVRRGPGRRRARLRSQSNDRPAAGRGAARSAGRRRGPPDEALAVVDGRRADIEYRQLDGGRRGGRRPRSTRASRRSAVRPTWRAGCAAAGTCSPTGGVPAAMVRAFEARRARLGDRLLAALRGRAGRRRRGVPGAFGGLVVRRTRAAGRSPTCASTGTTSRSGGSRASGRSGSRRRTTCSARSTHERAELRRARRRR